MIIDTINHGSMEISMHTVEAQMMAEALYKAAQWEDEELDGVCTALYEALSMAFASGALACDLQQEIAGGGNRLYHRTIKPPNRKANS